MAPIIVTLSPVSDRAEEIAAEIDKLVRMEHYTDQTYMTWTFQSATVSFEEAKRLLYDALSKADPEHQHLQIPDAS